MSKKPLTETRDIAKTIDDACPTPAAVPAWKSFKEIKVAALTASIIAADAQAKEAKKELLGKRNAHDVAVEMVEAENSGKSLEQFEDFPLFGYGIEDARVRRNLDKFGLNSAITAYIKTIRAKYPEDVKPTYTEEEKAQREAAMDNRARIGSLVSEYLRCFCEEIVNDVAHVAIEAALRAKRKIVLISHIFDANGFYLKSAPFKNLFVDLPAFVDAQMKFADKDNRALVAKTVLSYLGEFARNLTSREKYDLVRENIEQYIKSDKEEEAGVESAPVPAPAASSSAAPAPAPAGEAAQTKKKKDARFSFYIKKMLSVIRDSDPRYENIRFNHDLTPFIDTILNEFIQIVAMRAIVHITTMEIQTVSTAIIRAIILGMMATPTSLFERKMAVEKVNGKWESRIAVPNVILFIDTIYPLGPRVHHPRKLVDAQATAGKAPAVPKQEKKVKQAKPAAAVAPALAPVAAQRKKK